MTVFVREQYQSTIRTSLFDVLSFFLFLVSFIKRTYKIPLNLECQFEYLTLFALETQKKYLGKLHIGPRVVLAYFIQSPIKAN